MGKLVNYIGLVLSHCSISTLHLFSKIIYKEFPSIKKKNQLTAFFLSFGFWTLTLALLWSSIVSYSYSLGHFTLIKVKGGDINDW